MHIDNDLSSASPPSTIGTRRRSHRGQSAVGESPVPATSQDDHDVEATIIWKKPSNLSSSLNALSAEQKRRTIIITSSTPPTAGQIARELSRSSEKSHIPQSDPEDTHWRSEHRESFRSDTSVRRVHSAHDVLDFTEGSDAERDTKSKSNRLGASNLRPAQSHLKSVFPSTSKTEHGWFKTKPTTKKLRTRILFYHRDDPHYGFTNFSDHPVTYKNKVYPTSEHLFQSLKFLEHRPLLAEHIRTCSEKPSFAFSEARRFQPEVRSDWKDVNIKMMDIAIFHKFTQHADLLEELLETGDAELVEDSDKDSFWGIGEDGKGRNELGKSLQRLRTKLREETKKSRNSSPL